MEALRIVILSIVVANVFCYPSVSSQQPQVSQHAGKQPAGSHQAQNIPDAVIQVPLNTEDASVTNHYPYQSTGLAPVSSYQPSSYNSGNQYGNRDVYKHEGSGWSYPYFGVSAGMDYLFSAYIGPVAWCLFFILAAFGLCVGVSRIASGSDMLGGFFQRSKDAVAGARALDLDNITNMVYQALDTYGKYAAKAARDQDTQSMKG